jgi:hypothetical protein
MCLNPLVKIGEAGCEDYDTIFDYPEYQETFYAAVKAKDGRLYRVQKMGKRLEHRGRVFYTVEQTDERESFLVTDAVTGAECGTFGWIKKHWDKFMSAAARYPDVMQYPLMDGEEQEEQPPVVSSEEFTGILDSLKQMYGGG